MPDHRTRCIRFATLLALVFVVCLPAGAAAGPATLLGQADSMHHQGVLQEQGVLALYRAMAEDTAQAPGVTLEAASGHGLYFKTDSVNVAGRTDLFTPTEPSDVGSPSDPLEGLRLHTTGASPRFDLRILATDHTTFHARLRGGIGLDGLPGAQLTSSGIQERDESGRDSPTDASHESFVRRVVDEPVTRTEARGGSVDVHVEGDFILEFYGIDVTLEAGNGTTWLISTGHDTENDTAVRTEHRRFLRLFVEDATLRFHHADVDRLVQWVSSDTTVRGDAGIVRFEGLRDWQGVLQETRQVQFPAGYSGTLTPQEDRLVVDLVRPQEPETPASAWLAPAGFNPLPIAAFLLATALVTVAVRAARSAPQLASMENALEVGSFGRAARVAGRILRIDPTRESAHLGRAIALSRKGHPERVVRDLERYLEQSEPSDGTLHYVLGLAYRDLGRETAACEALSEAVRRTPALAQQVSDVPAARRGPEGDAQGYT